MRLCVCVCVFLLTDSGLGADKSLSNWGSWPKGDTCRFVHRAYPSTACPRSRLHPVLRQGNASCSLVQSTTVQLYAYGLRGTKYLCNDSHKLGKPCHLYVCADIPESLEVEDDTRTHGSWIEAVLKALTSYGMRTRPDGDLSSGDGGVRTQPLKELAWRVGDETGRQALWRHSDAILNPLVLNVTAIQSEWHQRKEPQTQPDIINSNSHCSLPIVSRTTSWKYRKPKYQRYLLLVRTCCRI